MNNIIRLKIDVTKIDKERLFQGQKGTYLDAALIPTPDSKYGEDYMITQDVSREEREAGVKGAILGNAKIVQRNSQPQYNSAAPSKPEVGCPNPGQDDVPF